MSTVGTTVATLGDLAKSMDPNGKIARLIEILNQQNEILQDIPWMECNNGTQHTTSIRTGLPLGTWRQLYQGVMPSKTTRAQVTDSCGLLQNYAEPDKQLVDMHADPAAFRLSEANGIIEGMNQQVAQGLFYGNQLANRATFTGLSLRYNSLSAGNAANIIDAGGTGSTNTSIWFVVWGEDTMHGLYPKGIPAGLEQRNLGEATKQNADGSLLQVYRDFFSWAPGLTLRDWRYCVRIANIDVPSLSADVTKLKAIVSLMIQAQELMRENKGTPVWYMNRPMRSKLRLAILEKIGLNLTWESVAGKPVMMFDGVPVRRVEQILNTEARVV